MTLVVHIYIYHILATSRGCSTSRQAVQREEGESFSQGQEIARLEVFFTLCYRGSLFKSTLPHHDVVLGTSSELSLTYEIVLHKFSSSI